MLTSPLFEAGELIPLIAGYLPVEISGTASDLSDPAPGWSIPGSVRLDPRRKLTGPPGELTGAVPLPSRRQVTDLVAELRSGDCQEIVLYARTPADLAWVTRTWFTLRHAGVDGVHILNGGLTCWVGAAGPLVPSPAASPDQRHQPVRGGDTPAGSSAFVPSSGFPGRVELHTVDADTAALIAREGTLLDARSAARFHGDPRTGVFGHIPGAVHAPVQELIGPDGRFLPVIQARRWFLGHRGIGCHRVGAYCGGGVGSTGLVFVASLLGQRVDLFVDSWSGWSKDPERPVEYGPGTTSTRDDFDCAE